MLSINALNTQKENLTMYMHCLSHNFFLTSIQLERERGGEEGEGGGGGGKGYF